MCDLCHGKKNIPLLDLWASIKDMKSGNRKFIGRWVEGANGCFLCDPEPVHATVLAMLDKYGEPYIEPLIREVGFHMSAWDDPQGNPFMMIMPGPP